MDRKNYTETKLTDSDIILQSVHAICMHIRIIEHLKPEMCACMAPMVGDEVVGIDHIKELINWSVETSWAGSATLEI